jgi:hypothetical protein
MLIRTLDTEFETLDRRSRLLLERLDDSNIFRPAANVERSSCGELLVRSAALVEQTFGGLTTRLWDDPFEWTLPEKLGTTAGILEYLDEVEATRLRGFELFTADDELSRELPAPVKVISLFELLIQTLGRANHFQGRAFAAFHILTGEKPPRL